MMISTNGDLDPRARAEQLVDDAMRAGRTIMGADDPPPERARVAVIGGGIIGTSVLYHLAQNGLTDAVLLERHRLTSGTTWHPAGLVATVRMSHALTELARHSQSLYSRLSAESGVDNGFNERGCIALARRPERMTELAYTVSMAGHHGVAAQVLTPDEVVAHHPMVDPSVIVGGVLYPQDGTVNPGGSALGMATCAARAGARVCEGVTVQRIEVVDGRVRGVVTEHGLLECETVVLAAGLWTPQLASRAGVPIALHAAEHVWMMTEPVADPVWELPFIRDLDGHIYVRGYRDRLLLGAFEPQGKPVAVSDLPEPFAFGELTPDLPHTAPSLERARQCVPALRELTIERDFNGPESFTPDNLPIVGETPEVGGLFVAAGMNSQGMLLGPGVGRAIAEWLVAGAPTMDVADLSPGRFGVAQAGAAYLRERTRESLGQLYAMHWPDLQPSTARGLRRTPLHDRVASVGACFGETAGWERANWYAQARELAEYEYSWGRAPYFGRVAEEHRAARERVALFDLSSFSKIQVEGSGALSAVQHVFASDLDVPVGRVVYTTMLNERGGVEMDLTVSRLADERFLVVAPAVAQRAVLHRLRHHAQGAAVTDLTAALATLAVMGPDSRRLLAGLVDAPLDDSAFPFGTCQELWTAAGPALALRVSYVGELGWELYPSAESATALYDAVSSAGAELGAAPAGYHALDTLRAEKGYLHWPHDVGPTDQPRHVGLGFTIGWNKPSFIGREAVLAARERPLDRRLLYVRLDDPQPLLRHGETVRFKGRQVGRVTSGAYGHHFGCAVGLAMIDDPELVGLPAMAEVEGVGVEVATTVAPARLSRRPWYDPGNERLRGSSTPVPSAS